MPANNAASGPDGEAQGQARALAAHLDGMRLIHVLPGRLRAEIRGLKGDLRRARELEEHLLALPVVHDAVASAVTGTLLVRFHGPDEREEGQLQQLLGGSGAQEIERLEVALQREWHAIAAARRAGRRPDWSAIVRDFSATMNEQVGQATGGPDLRFLMPASLLGLAAIRLLGSPLTFPRWYELMWFCFTSFQQLNIQTRGAQKPEASPLSGPLPPGSRSTPGSQSTDRTVR